MSKFGYPSQNKTKETGRKGESYFEWAITSKFGWIYRPVHQESDYGIDGYIDVVENGAVTGQSIAVQIKCGDSYISKATSGGIKYEGENKHLNYFMNNSSPVILVVIDSKCSVIYWRQFEAEITHERNNGWWIEIPSRNVFDENTKQKLLNLVGEPEDYSDPISSMWLLDNIINDAGFMSFTIPKEEVLIGSTEYIEGVIKRLSKNKALMLRNRGAVEIFFPEYDDDPREIIEIPEIRNWFGISMDRGIPWFYFLSSKGKAIGLKLLLYSTCSYTVKKQAQDGWHLEVEKEDLSNWFDINFHNLNVFTEENDISIEINKELSEGVCESLFRNP